MIYHIAYKSCNIARKKAEDYVKVLSYFRVFAKKKKSTSIDNYNSVDFFVFYIQPKLSKNLC